MSETKNNPSLPDAVESSSACGGMIKVHESVVASIVRKTACSVDGVIRLAGGSFVDSFAEIVGSKKIFSRSIVIDMQETGVRIEVRIIVAYGRSVPEIAKAVQKEVYAEITSKTGMQVQGVDVLVMDLDDPRNEELSEEFEAEQIVPPLP